MKKLIHLILLIVIVFTGCSSPALSKNPDNNTSKNEVGLPQLAKKKYYSISEMKSAQKNEKVPWLKAGTKFFYIDESKVNAKITEIQVGEFVTFIKYKIEGKNSAFLFQQQQFKDGNEAYKNTIERGPGGIEDSLNGSLYHLAKTSENIVVNMAVDNTLLSFIFPLEFDDQEMIKILRSVNSEVLP